MISNRIFYLLALITVGWAITYFLRALPFILFSLKIKKLPPWIDKVGIIISPIIIAFLIVYSYSSLKYTTLSPYIAGLITVILQLIARNPLVSIIAGTISYMLLIR